MKFTGDVRCTLCAAVDEYAESVVSRPGFSSVFIDLSEAENLDSTTLGLIAKVGILSRRHHATAPVIYCSNASINRLLDSMGLGSVFEIHSCCSEVAERLDELPAKPCSESEMRETVIEAHRVLMGLSEKNRAEFKNLLDVLEAGTPPDRRRAAG